MSPRHKSRNLLFLTSHVFYWWTHFQLTKFSINVRLSGKRTQIVHSQSLETCYCSCGSQLFRWLHGLNDRNFYLCKCKTLTQSDWHRYHPLTWLFYPALLNRRTRSSLSGICQEWEGPARKNTGRIRKLIGWLRAKEQNVKSEREEEVFLGVANRGGKKSCRA